MAAIEWRPALFEKGGTRGTSSTEGTGKPMVMLHRSPTTIPSERRDVSEWRRGREAYAVWVLRCDESRAIQEKFAAAREHLDGYLLEPYRRQPHITLLVCGFLVEKPRYDDDVTRAELGAQSQALAEAGVGPFEIEIGGMNSFASAPFLEVRDPCGGIQRLRRVLARGAREFRTAPYVPHLTIGLYSDAFPSRELLARMAAFAGAPVRGVVERVTFATYRADVFAGKLGYEFDLGLAL
jgi:2'-5' RNA ligase